MEENITIFGAYPQIYVGEILDRIGTKLTESIRQKCQGENCQAFSGGEKQLVTFLRGIAKNAELVLMDEPFSAIDRNTKLKLYDYIFESDDFKEKTIIMVTHDVAYEVLKRFDRVIKIEVGDIRKE